MYSFGAENDQLLSVIILDYGSSVYCGGSPPKFHFLLFFLTVNGGHILLLKKDIVCT